MSFRVSVIVFFALSLFSSAAFGLLEEVDYTKRAEGFQNQLYGSKFETPQSSQRWMTQKFRTTRYSTPEHRFADDRFDGKMMERFQSRRFKTDQLSFETREPVMFRNDGEMFGGSQLERIRYNTLHHDAKRESRVADVGAAINIEEFLGRLSLADLNRYQFRKSRSREPGIPVQQAAAGILEE